MLDFRLSRWKGYKTYHVMMVKSGDCDPAYPALNYVADRFELNREQRFWLAFLYSLSYCAATAYYMVNEFPDYENVDVGRLERWWQKNKKKVLFQTDRAKVKNFDLVVRIYQSYRSIMGDSQAEWFFSNVKETPQATYDFIFSKLEKSLFYYKRYSLFLLLEAIHELTKFPMQPTGLNLQEAESCRNGLIYACGKDRWIQKKKHRQPLKTWQYKYLQEKLEQLYSEIKAENPDIPTTYWNIETTLCAYKKLFWETRYFGYYIDRQMEEILKMQRNIPVGVDWSVLWDFRKEFFDRRLLGEFNGWKGIRTELCHYVMQTGRLSPYPLPEFKKRRSIVFEGSECAYKKEPTVVIL